MTRAPRWASVAAAVVVVGLCVGYGFAPARGQERLTDQRIYRTATEHMRHGDEYYRAMDRALRATNGPAETPRAFRPPTVFLLWRVLPSQRWVWLAFVAFVGATSLLLLRLTGSVLAGPLVAIYLLTTGRPHHPSGFLDQYLLVEFWALPAAVGALLAVRGRRWWLAAGLALLATLVRELAGGLVVGGLLAAHVLHRPRRPWIVAAAVAAGAYALHVHLLSSHLVAHGREVALLGTGQGVHTVLSMMDVGLGGPFLLGAVLWCLAVWRVTRERELSLIVSLYLTLPILGLLVGRDYWGILVVPFTIAWSCELAEGWIGRRLAARPGRRSEYVFDPDLSR